MSISYVSQKCTSCAATKLEYVKELKAWRCAYCGALIERHEQADSMFTIKNVVRQSILDVAYGRLDNAEKNIVECEKIDSRYVGTIIAKLSFEVNKIFNGSCSQSEQKNIFAQIKKNYASLCENGTKPNDQEIALYEFFESAEVIGILILVYDSLGAMERRDFLFKYFEPGEVYSMSLNNNLIRFAVKNEKYDLIDKIILNTDNLDKKSAISILMEQYPDGEQKAQNISFLISQNALEKENKSVIENYLENSKDNISTKYKIACAACATEVCPSVECLMKSIISDSSDLSYVKGIIEPLMSKRLMDMEIYSIVDYAINKCTSDVAVYIFEQLSETKQFVVLTYKYFVALLENKNFSAESKKKIISVASGFNINEKTKETFVSSYLCNIKDTAENRKILIPYLVSLVDTLPTNSVEKYLLNCVDDKEYKPEVVKMIFETKINKSFFRDTFDKYIVSGKDDPDVKNQIFNVLAEAGLYVSEGACVSFALGNSMSDNDKIYILRKFKSGGVRFDNLLNQYILGIEAEMFSPNLFAEIIDYSDSVSEAAFCKYLLLIKDLEASKARNVAKLLEKCRVSANMMSCSVNHLNNNIECNAIQAYILICPDSITTAASVVSQMNTKCVKLNTDIIVSGVRKKMKKYLSLNKDYLSEDTIQLAVMFGVL